jgi:hypothetical protein
VPKVGWVNFRLSRSDLPAAKSYRVTYRNGQPPQRRLTVCVYDRAGLGSLSSSHVEVLGTAFHGSDDSDHCSASPDSLMPAQFRPKIRGLRRSRCRCC